MGTCRGEVGVTGQRGTVICRSGDRVALQSAGQPGAQIGGCHREAGGAATAPERDPGGPDIALLVRRAAEGDRWAWERLVDQYARLIWSITRDFKLVESDAADVFQATWLRLLEHINRLEQPARVGSWLAATARNECLRHLATRNRVVPGGDDLSLGDIAAYEPEIDERLLADERAKIVREALAHLPWRWRR